MGPTSRVSPKKLRPPNRNAPGRKCVEKYYDKNKERLLQKRESTNKETENEFGSDAKRTAKETVNTFGSKNKPIVKKPRTRWSQAKRVPPKKPRTHLAQITSLPRKNPRTHSGHT